MTYKDDLDVFPTVVRQALERARPEIASFEQLAELTEDELRAIKGIGPFFARYISHVLAGNGFIQHGSPATSPDEVLAMAPLDPSLYDALWRLGIRTLPQLIA